MSSNETFDTDIVDISEFFSGGDSGSSASTEESDQKSTFSEVDSPIKELKIIILSLDWEITDEIADSFITEVDRLADVWKTDKVVVSFLQILRALGKYLRTHKADAHPDSVSLLYSVYNNFEKIVLTDEISTDQEKSILDEELQKFAKLKGKIAEAAAAASTGTANESLLSALKSILLEIDWNITNQTMQKFDIEINKLEKVWSTSKDFLTPLQMMRAIGSYINKNKLDSHPESIKLLSSVFKNFEKMALTDEMGDEERKQIIEADLKKFTDLKEQILNVKQDQDQPASEDVVPEPTETPQEPVAELPGQIHDESDDTETSDIGFVAPIDDATSDSEQPLNEVADLASQEGETVEEVGSRLDDLFGENDSDSPMEEIPDISTTKDDESVMPLPGMESSEDNDASASFDEVTPLPDGDDEIVPLPGMLPADQADTAEVIDDVVPLEGGDETVPLPGVAPADQADTSDTLDDVVPLEGGDETVPLPGVAPADQADTTDALDDVVPLEGEDETVPLPGVVPADQADTTDALDDVVPLEGGDEIVPLPGMLPSDQSETATALEDAVPLEDEPQEAAEHKEQASVDIDNHVDDFFGDEKDSGELTEVPPVTDDSPSEQPEPMQSSCKSNNLLSIIDSINFSDDNIDYSTMSDEIINLQQTFSDIPSLQVFLQLINSTLVYMKLLGSDAHKDSSSMLKSFAESLLEAEKQSESDDSLLLFQLELDEFTQFQETVIFPALSDMANRENEIKKILGVAK